MDDEQVMKKLCICRRKLEAMIERRKIVANIFEKPLNPVPFALTLIFSNIYLVESCALVCRRVCELT